MTQKQRFVNALQKQGLSFNCVDYSKTVSCKTTEDYDRLFKSVCKHGADLPILNERYKVILDPNNSRLNEDWQRILKACQLINAEGDQREVGFHMFAEQRADGLIYVTDLILDSAKIRKATIEDEQELFRQTKEHVQKCARNGTKPIVIKAHTHPSQEILNYPNHLANSWSLGDYYADFTASDAFDELGCQEISLLITPSLDTNMLFFDRPSQKFYRFNSGVYTMNAERSAQVGKTVLTAMPCYSSPHKQSVKLVDPSYEMQR